jgi:nuclear pore complex protein Nup188
LAKILVGSEIVLGRYDFLLGCIRLFEALVQDAVTQSVKRKASERRTPERAIARFGSAPISSSGTSDKIMSNVLLVFGRTLTGIFESSSTWRFTRLDHKLGINILLSGAFNTILRYAYGFDDSEQLSQKLFGALGPIAEYLVDLFLSTSENDLPTSPIISVLISTSDIQSTTILTRTDELWSRQTRSALQFSNTLIRVGMLLGRTSSHLEHQLFKAAPLLARLYAIDEAYRSPVVILLESLVRSAARTDGEPPSLLGYLGPETAKCFLQIVYTLNQPFKTASVEIDIWRLLSAVVSCKQQWLAIYLLTGSTPKESLKSKGAAASSSRGKPLFTLALDELSQINLSHPQRTIAMLEFVILAQNTWPWAMSSLRGHKEIVPGVLKFLKTLRTQEIRVETEMRTIEKSYENKIAALITEFLAMYLHIARQVGDISSLAKIVENLGYLENCGVAVPAYNASLHASFKANLPKNINGVQVTSFKKTELTPSEFGFNFFYDVELGEMLLSFHSWWKGNGKDTENDRHKQKGLQEEFRKVNANLSLVESQILLLKGWKLLAAELSNLITKEKKLEGILIKTAKDCLKANTMSTLPEHLFGRLMTLRVEFAFLLIQKLANAKVQDPEARSLFIAVWDSIVAMRPSFEAPFIGERADYYRSLLKVLFLSLRFLVPDATNVDSPNARQSVANSGRVKILATSVNEASYALLEILSEVIAKGFHALANQLHDNKDSCSPSDFILLTGLLQTILGLPEIRVHMSEAALLFQNHNTSRYATSLFSWSDQLAEDRDPVYGELSVLFLLELSSMPVMAENLAVDGVLSRLNTANLINYYRRPAGMGPFDDPPRLFSIWNRGILPLCLNLLDAVGAPIAAEVATFLNQFPAQLARAAACLNPRSAPTAKNPNAGHITLGMASEAHSLALIVLVLDKLRASASAVGIIAADVPELEWDKASVKEDVEEWMQGRRGLRDRIAPTNEREVALVGMPSQMEGVENVLEERVVAEFEATLECLGGSAS